MITQANDEQLRLIKLHLLIPVALDALELDVKAIEPMSFGHIYAAQIRQWQDRLSFMLNEVNVAMRRDKIKVHLIESKKPGGIVAEYRIGGYVYPFTMVPRFIRAEIEVLLMEISEGK